MSLAAELGETLGIEATVTPGGRSQFDVLADGALVYSKQAKDRFPDEGEIVRLLGSDG